ncbi:MAG: tRNA (adenosine(37)-N6)-threonylcarbamoyltransferase complex ATPase subunit type 1 TsaE [Burkholderia sp.]|nr:tRNA (adenosine(37)-N6)-threonylcarbamoyltransferase complex ATPase subunit type 1 TsaE [Burkholderia sp.]
MPAIPIISQKNTIALPPVLGIRKHILSDEAETRFFGERFSKALVITRLEHIHTLNGLQIQLLGDLGIGKTTFVRAILRGLGYQDRIRSPTYTLLEPYVFEREDRKFEIYHFDLYRFNELFEWSDVGFREYFNSNTICLIEWPQKASVLLGIPDLIFLFDFDGNRRTLTIIAYSALGKIYLERC